MSLSLRYINANHKVQEIFIDFLDCREHVYRQRKYVGTMSTNNIDDELEDDLCNFDPTKKLEPKLSEEVLGNNFYIKRKVHKT